jgi:hypothetical protein
VSDTTDVDVDDAHPVILIYVYKIHDIKCPNVDERNPECDETSCSFPGQTRAEAKTHVLIIFSSRF